MTQELLQAVLDQPDDDAPRLAYAAECERSASEIDRARGEFIRSQIAVAHSSEDFLISPDGQRLRLRIANLQDAYGGVWNEALSALATRLTYRRGFVEYVTVKAIDLVARGREIFALAPVRHMDITGVRDVDERIFSSRSLARLLSLGMDNCGLYTFHVRLLFASGVTAKLRWLSLDHNNLDLGAAEAIAESPFSKDLECVILSGNPVDPTEQMGWDSGALISLWMPPEGEELERRFGPLRWLQRTHGTPARYEP